MTTMQAYERLKDLGEGGYGKAMLCRRKSDRQMMVIKEVRISALSAKDRKAATQEAAVLASLKHPNIVEYVSSFTERGCFYIVMEFADGGDLAQKIEKRHRIPFSEDEVLHDFIQLCLAIKYIHDRKILHRDLKTQNVFLTKSGRVKLGDFGIARVLEHTFQLCRTQIGTPYYLSPEICEGKNYNSKTDIWSLGCILYELCTLKHAFEGANMNGLLINIARGRFAPIPAVYSHDLKGLIDSMLTKDPQKRPNINQILTIPFLKRRINSLLDQAVLEYEFNHTILHGRKPFAAPTVVLSPQEGAVPLPPRPPSAGVQRPPRPSLGPPVAPPPPPPKQVAPAPEKVKAVPRPGPPPPPNVDPRYQRVYQRQDDEDRARREQQEADERKRKEAAEAARVRQAEDDRRRKEAAEADRRRKEAEEKRRKQIEEDARRKRQAAEERKKAQREEEERRKQLEMDDKRKRDEEEERQRRRIAQEGDEERRRQLEEEERKRDEQRQRDREEQKRIAAEREEARQRRLEEERKLAEDAKNRKRAELQRQFEEAEELRRQEEEARQEERRKAALKRQRDYEERQRIEEEIAARKRDEQQRRREEIAAQRREEEELERRKFEEVRARASAIAEQARQRKEEEQARLAAREAHQREEMAAKQKERDDAEAERQRKFSEKQQRQAELMRKAAEYREEQARIEEERRQKAQPALPSFVEEREQPVWAHSEPEDDPCARIQSHDFFAAVPRPARPAWVSDPIESWPENDGPEPNIESIAKHEISEEDRRRLYREQRDAAKRNRNQVREIEYRVETQYADETPSPRGEPNIESIAKHEISEEDRRRLYREQRDAAKRNRNQVREIEYKVETQYADETPSPRGEPNIESIAKHEISEEDRRRLYREQREAAKRNRIQVRDIEYRSDAAKAEPIKDDRIAKHQISEEDRRRVYREQREAAKRNRNQVRDVEYRGEAPQQAAETPPRVREDRIANHEIGEEERRRLYREQREAAKRNRNQVRDVEYRSELDEPEFVPQQLRDERIAKYKVAADRNRKQREVDDDLSDFAADDGPSWARSPPQQKVPRLLPRIHSEPDLLAREAANHELQGFTESLREVLALDPEQANVDDTFEDVGRKKPHVFRLNDRKIALPAGSDLESLKYRAEAIHADLERQIGAERLVALKRELETADDEERVAASFVEDLQPGLVCLAQQLIVLDGKLEGPAQ